MAIIQCRNGHHYDDNKYWECPVCARMRQQGNSLSDRENQKTIGQKYIFPNIPEYETVWLNRTLVGDDIKTVGQFSSSKGNNYVTGWFV